MNLLQRLQRLQRNLSLRLLLVLAFFCLGLGLVFGYSLLSGHFFIRGMDTMMLGNMETIGRHWLNSPPPLISPFPQNRHELTQIDGYLITADWQALPESFRTAFPEQISEPGILFKHDESGWLTPPDVIHFIMRYEDANGYCFVGQRVSHSTASELIGRDAGQSRRLLIKVGALVLLPLLLIIVLLLRMVSRPVRRLGNWADHLDEQRLAQPPPDFVYPELNNLAGLIRTSLSSLRDELQRKQRFLRHASHELRTPIAVIRNNVELFRRLGGEDSERDQANQANVPNESTQTRTEQMKKSALDRIDRAAHTMQQLTETLLWLERDTEQLTAGAAGTVRSVELEKLLHELVDELRYLLNGKDVRLHIHAAPHTLELPLTAARIVLANLIRNSFQHTTSGSVEIVQQGATVTIRNSTNDNEPTELGFGLGLQLVEQLTDRLGWEFDKQRLPATQTESFFQTKITFIR